MGQVKRMLDDDTSNKESDRSVCVNCVCDDFLGSIIEAAADEELECSYCEGEGAAVAALHALIEPVEDGLLFYWTDPSEELPYSSADGGFQGGVLDTREVLSEIGLGWCETLEEDVAAAISQEFWCKRNYFAPEDSERLLFGWRDFERTIKHSSRYVALLPMAETSAPVDPDEIPVAAMLVEVERCIRECSLFEMLPIGTALFRARSHLNSERLTTAAQLGAPTAEQARFPNRMSAAGIAVFYGAFDPETAAVETIGSEKHLPQAVTLGRFKTLRHLNVLNLCNLPELPSYFDTAQAERRAASRFLRDFAKTVSRPVVKDGREHVDYVPTQVFAEYARFRMRVNSNEPVHGVVYPSAQVNQGRCCVLFCDQELCGQRSKSPATNTGWIELEPATVTTFSLVGLVAAAAQQMLNPAKTTSSQRRP